MDEEIKKRTREAIEHLKKEAVKDLDFENMDPVAKMMLMAVLHEGQKLEDEIESIPQKIRDRYFTDFVPYEMVGAMPAITILQLIFKSTIMTDMVTVGSGASFLYRGKDSKLKLNYLPLFETKLLPYTDMFELFHNRIRHHGGIFPVDIEPTNQVWVGLVTDVEIECLQGLSFYVKGTKGILPEHLYVVAENRNTDTRELEFATMHEMENVKILEPFDAQQSSGQFLSIVENWKACLLNMNDAALLYVTDAVVNRDLFKPHSFPKSFQQWLEDDSLDRFRPNTLWLRMDFQEDYVIPDTLEIVINALPVVNVDINSVMLTPSTPIAKLQKQDSSFFLRVIEPSTASRRQGFNESTDEVIIRDFDASCYHDGDLYREVRTLYNRFLDDYYAFVEYRKIKDGELLRHLREIVNKIGEGVGVTNDKFRFDSGTYAMRNISQENKSSSTKVTFMTTLGKAGEMPQIGETMENRKVPGILSKVNILVSAMGGADKSSVLAAAMGGIDKASVDEQHKELLRYYALTNDRLYTRMDIDAFLRKDIMLTFGREEYHRIFIRLKVEGAGGQYFLRRGLYIDIEFKDKKNYEKAQRLNWGTLIHQRITNLSCISMPIIVTLKNLEG